MSEAKQLHILVVSEDRDVRNHAMVALHSRGEGLGEMVKNWKEPLTVTFHNVEPTVKRVSEVMEEIKPGLFSTTERQAREIDSYQKTQVELAERITHANQMILQAGQVDTASLKQWSLDQALRVLNGKQYPQTIEMEIEHQLNSKGIESREDFKWETHVDQYGDESEIFK